MTQRIFFPMLPSLNELLARSGGVSGYNRTKRRLQADLVWAIKAAKLKPVERVTMVYTWAEPNKRRDPSNISAGGRKLIEDALVDAGVLANDGWAQIEGWQDRFTVCPLKPGVWVELEEIG
jgi:hypothetical protein